MISAALLVANVCCSHAQNDAHAATQTAAQNGATSSPARRASAPGSTTVSDEEAQLYRDAARVAWRYMTANYQSETGFVSATADWPNTTVWDIGGQLIAFHAAKELGIIDSAEYTAKTAAALGSLERAPLFRGVAYSKAYSTKTGAIGDGGGHGFAATDLGRLLIALKIIATTDPQFASQAGRVEQRINFAPIVTDGYLHGQLIGSSGKPWVFQEGRLGYEQYVARGFKEWGADAPNALSLTKNSAPVTVYGVPLLKDTRYQDRLLSEPFILYGLELGMPADIQQLAENVLRAQQARFDSTGIVTAVSEDASSTPPYYFYYYCVYCNAKPFVVDIAEPGHDLDSPRWVSTKAAYGWNALMPSEYTRKVVSRVAPAMDDKRGWASGVMESTGASTKAWDINTASVVLESAAYVLRGRKPLIVPAASTPR